jgi:hypothetical protein
MTGMGVVFPVFGDANVTASRHLVEPGCAPEGDLPTSVNVRTQWVVSPQAPGLASQPG